MNFNFSYAFDDLNLNFYYEFAKLICIILKIS